jgi:hypothetical protein
LKHIYAPITSADQWKGLLPRPERQWKTGYSARAIAHSWLSSRGIPREVEVLFTGCGISAFRKIRPLIVLPEHSVPLPPASGHPSQTDVFVLARVADKSLISIAVEGKVSESFDKTVREWMKPRTRGKQERLAFLTRKLRLPPALPHDARYQLLHRLASAIVEAERVGAAHAAMVIHSFSQSDEWFSDFRAFVWLYGEEIEVGELKFLGMSGSVAMYAGWARGDARFLAA